MSFPRMPRRWWHGSTMLAASFGPRRAADLIASVLAVELVVTETELEDGAFRAALDPALTTSSPEVGCADHHPDVTDLTIGRMQLHAALHYLAPAQEIPRA